MPSAILHYGELALKGRNRPWFITTLLRNIRSALKGLDVDGVRLVVGRIEVRYRSDTDWPEIQRRVARIPGIGNFSRATRVEPTLDAMISAVLPAVRGLSARSFRIRARRADKRFPYPTPEIERIVGRSVQEETGWPVDLSHPEFVLYIEVLTDDAFVFVEKERGAGGLPVGTSGKVLCLLSGGIDSPVAAARMMRRGCRAAFVHFHSYPILTRTSQDKARELVRRLTAHQQRSRLFLVPFGGIQQQVVVSVPPPLRIVTYRRLMMRIAERLAYRARAHALVTGDSVGQVASQTVENLTAIESAATMPILRPLVAFDKDEITQEAHRLGTYEVSIIQDEDCCSLFTPPFPSTRTTREVAEAAERLIDVAALVDQAVEAAVVEDFRFPMLESAAAHSGATAGEHS